MLKVVITCLLIASFIILAFWEKQYDLCSRREKIVEEGTSSLFTAFFDRKIFNVGSITYHYIRSFAVLDVARNFWLFLYFPLQKKSVIAIAYGIFTKVVFLFTLMKMVVGTICKFRFEDKSTKQMLIHLFIHGLIRIF